MSELENLGDALRGQLHGLVSDIDPSDALWAMVEAIPEAATRPRLRDRLVRRPMRLTRRRLALTLPLPVAAVASTAAMVIGGATPSTSFGTGVTWLPNGDVNMAQIVVTHPARANAVFRRVGFPAVAIPMTDSCPYHRGFTYEVMRAHPSPVTLYERARRIDHRYVTVQAAKLIGPNRLLVAEASGTVGRVPPCASSHGHVADVPARLTTESSLPKLP